VLRLRGPWIAEHYRRPLATVLGTVARQGAATSRLSGPGAEACATQPDRSPSTTQALQPLRVLLGAGLPYRR
jgi:hypothetical protein